MMMARKTRSSRSIKRKKSIIEPNIRIVAFCEGKSTEPKYIETFRDMYGNGLVDVKPIKAAGVPYTLIEKACCEKKRLDIVARKSKDPLDKKFQVWAVFDCDEHPRISESFKMAKDNGIYIGYSNPCFEIWPMLHIQSLTAEIHRHALQRKLAKFIVGYDANGSKEACPRLLAKTYDNSYEIAKNRAIFLHTEHTKVGLDKANPYTDVYKLFDLIKKNGKKRTICK